MSAGEEGMSAGEEGRSAGEEGRSVGEEGRSAGEEGRSAGEEGMSAGFSSMPMSQIIFVVQVLTLSSSGTIPFRVRTMSHACLSSRRGFGRERD